MTTKDKALRMALDALNEVWLLGDAGAGISGGAIVACRAALAQKDEQEPVAYMYPDDFKRMCTEETSCTVFSIPVGSPEQGLSTVKLYSHPHEQQEAPSTAPEFLRRAAEIMEERGKQYDKPEGERSMGKCVAAFNIVTGRSMTEAEGWLLLQILKDVRLWQRPGFHRDSAEDAIAYAALKAEAKRGEA